MSVFVQLSSNGRTGIFSMVISWKWCLRSLVNSSIRCESTRLARDVTCSLLILLIIRLDLSNHLSSKVWKPVRRWSSAECVNLCTLTAYLIAKFHLLSRARHAALVARGNQESEPYLITEATQANITFLAVGGWRPSLRTTCINCPLRRLTQPFKSIVAPYC